MPDTRKERRSFVNRIERRIRHIGSEHPTRHYHVARRFFLAIFRLLIERNAVPSALQFESLYRALRWVKKTSFERKIAVIREAFGSETAIYMSRRFARNPGIIGGGMGSIAPTLVDRRRRQHLWRLLRDVYGAHSPDIADAAVVEYYRHEIPGLGPATLGSFLWALKEQWYPIVNNGNKDGLREVFTDFVMPHDMVDYMNVCVPTLREFKNRYCLSSFTSVELFFYHATEGNWSLPKSERVPYQPQERSINLAVTEGDRAMVSVWSRKRSSVLRQQVIAERGKSCQICGFNFAHRYGVEYAEVHHIKPLAETGPRRTTAKDLLVVCRNCHAMLHSTRYHQDWKLLRRVVRQKRMAQ